LAAKPEPVANQFTQKAGVRMSGHGPHRPDVEQGHADADEHGDHQQALGAGQAFGQRQGNEGVEAKTDLRTGGVVSQVQSRAQNGPVGQAVRQGNCANSQTQTCPDQTGGRIQIDGAFQNRVKQQDREQEEINQTFNLEPDWAIQPGETANQIAAQNQGKIGKEELGEVHRSRITSLCRHDTGRCRLGALAARFREVFCVKSTSKAVALPMMFDLLRSS
jgi:hypothetical protein